MVPGGPWHIAGWLPAQLREVFQKPQATSRKQQALDKKGLKDYIGWYVKERITENCRRPEQAKQDAWTSV